MVDTAMNTQETNPKKMFLGMYKFFTNLLETQVMPMASYCASV